MMAVAVVKRTRRDWGSGGAGLACVAGVPGLGSAEGMQSINLAQLLLRSEAGRQSDGQARNIFTNFLG